MSRSWWTTTSAVALALGLAATAAADTFCVGTGEGSTHPSLGLALGASTGNGPGYDLIKVPTNVSYTGIGLAIGNQSLEIAGGYPDCVNPTTSGRTIIRGPGISQKTVFEVNNVSEPTRFVAFRDLFITEGEDDDDDGGGLQVGGWTVVSLWNTKLTLNHSENGGGILIDGTGGAILTIDEASEIIDNRATVDGGGIHCSNGGTIFAAGKIGLNGAYDSATDTDGNGAGVYLDDCSFTNVGPLEIYTHTGNTGLGAGIYAANGSTLDLLGDAEPVLIRGNRALRGGGIYLTGAGTTALLGNTHVVDNSVREGGAGLWVGNGAHVDVDCFRNSSVPTPCSSISDNVAGDFFPPVVDSGGGGLLLRDGGTATIFHTTLSGNQAINRLGGPVPTNSPGGAVFVIGSGSEVIFESSLITASAGINAIQTDLGGSVDMRFSTAAGHASLPEGETRDGVEYFIGMASTTDSLELRSSIVWNEVGVEVVGNRPQGAHVLFDCLIVNEMLSAPAGSFGIDDSDPRFLAAAAGDYHLATDSPAIDYCDDVATTPQTEDIDGDSRVPGFLGFFDIGMDESTLIFTDGFESGDVSAWG